MEPENNKVNFNVEIHFLNLPTYKTKVMAINKCQAIYQSLKEHREKTLCSENEMYDAIKSKAIICNF